MRRLLSAPRRRLSRHAAAKRERARSGRTLSRHHPELVSWMAWFEMLPALSQLLWRILAGLCREGLVARLMRRQWQAAFLPQSPRQWYLHLPHRRCLRGQLRLFRHPPFSWRRRRSGNPLHIGRLLQKLGVMLPSRQASGYVPPRPASAALLLCWALPTPCSMLSRRRPLF